MEPNPHLQTYICSAISNPTSASKPSNCISRTELDSHANMAVLGRNCFIFDYTGRSCNVSAFNPSLDSTTLPIVDAVIVYDCPYSLSSYLLMIRNALYLEQTEDNLVPPFLLREAGVIVNECAKMHAIPHATEEHHSIFFPEENLRIPLSLHGIFSYFPHRAPHLEEIEDLQVLFLTPDSSTWDPHSPHFNEQESQFLSHDGSIVDKPLKPPSFLITDEDTADNTSAFSLDASSYPSLETLESFIDKSIDSDHACQFIHDTTTCSMPVFESSIFSASLQATIGSAFASATSLNDNFFMKHEEKDSLCNDDYFSATISSAVGNEPNKLSSKFLSKIWCINDDLAQQTIDNTTQLQRHSGTSSLSRQYSTNDRMLRYKRINSLFFTDTFFVTKAAKSKPRNNTCMQLFVSDKGFVAVYPLQSKGQFYDALKLFCKEIGVPEKLVMDPSGEQKSSKVKTFGHKVSMTLQYLEESTQWANRAELYIGLFKESIRKDLRTSDCPMVLWDFCAERRALIHNLMPSNLFQNSGQSPMTATLGVQGDISNLCVFGWYDWCYYREESNHQFPFQKYLLGRVLGPAKNDGNMMAQNVLTHNGTVVPRRTLRRLTATELNSDVEKKKRHDFDARVKSILGDSISLPPASPPVQLELKDFSAVEGDIDFDPELLCLPIDDDPVDSKNNAILETPITDALINAEIILPKSNSSSMMGKVLRRSTDKHGCEIGQYDQNPLLNTATYDVLFPDGSVHHFGANVIAQNLYSQIDDSGHTMRRLDSLLDHKTDNTAVPKSEMYITTQSGQKRLRRSTMGWYILAQWTDGTQEWIPLKLLKEHFPVEVAEYSVAHGLQNEPAFAYWINHVLKKRDKIISSVKARVSRTTHKYGIEIPRSVEHARQLDKINGNTLWMDALGLEMSTINVAFDFKSHDFVPPSDYSKSSGHIIWDVKMDFTRKARWVKNGHLTKDPDHSTFAGVVSCESIRIMFTYAALNGLDVCAADIKSAYLQAPTSEKHYIICGPEFGPDKEGKIALITRALYGGKSAGSDYWKHMRACMRLLRFEPCKGDQDVWRRPATKPDGTQYYTYVCLYVDDCLCVDVDPQPILTNEIGRYWTLKDSSVGPPNIYLGNKVSKVTLANNVTCWSFSSSQYVQNAVSNVTKYLKERNLALPKRASAPFRGEYRPEIDCTPELTPSEAAYFQSLIGVLRWIVELGRVDITCEVSELASMMAMPREGHLDQVYHIFAYLRNKHNAELVLDPTPFKVGDEDFPTEDWSHTVYADATEPIGNIDDIPEPRGLGFDIRAFVDADHAGNLVTRRSRTGFIIFLNNSPIYWLSKRQTGIETSSFGSEFMAMKHCCEYLRGLRFKLRSMGIPVIGPCYICGDNKSVLVNSSKPDSVLKKKSTSIAYHYVREGSASDEWRMTYVNTDDNCADMLSKSLPSGRKRKKFTSMILHHVYDHE